MGTKTELFCWLLLGAMFAAIMASISLIVLALL